MANQKFPLKSEKGEIIG